VLLNRPVQVTLSEVTVLAADGLRTSIHGQQAAASSANRDAVRAVTLIVTYCRLWQMIVETDSIARVSSFSAATDCRRREREVNFVIQPVDAKTRNIMVIPVKQTTLSRNEPRAWQTVWSSLIWDSAISGGYVSRMRSRNPKNVKIAG